jgi:hypothetical protein
MQRRFQRARHSSALVASTLLAPVMLLSAACGAPAAAIKGLNEARGQFTGPQGRIVLVINPGVAPQQLLRSGLDPVIAQAATDGARVQALVLNGGSAASMVNVGFSAAAGGGDFYPPGANPAAWRLTATNFASAAMVDLGPALTPDQALAATGNDLAGALQVALTTVREMPGSGPLQVVVITGGGVQRTAALDLIAAQVSPANAAALAQKVPPITPDGIDVEMVGVGQFPGMPVDPVFADGVAAWWHDLCPQCQFR